MDVKVDYLLSLTYVYRSDINQQSKYTVKDAHHKMWEKMNLKRKEHIENLFGKREENRERGCVNTEVSPRLPGQINHTKACARVHKHAFYATPLEVL